VRIYSRDPKAGFGTSADYSVSHPENIVTAEKDAGSNAVTPLIVVPDAGLEFWASHLEGVPMVMISIEGSHWGRSAHALETAAGSKFVMLLGPNPTPNHNYNF